MTVISELEQTLLDLSGYENSEMYWEVMSEYKIQALQLKIQNSSKFYDKLSSIQEELDKIEQKLPNVSDKEFDRYVFLVNLVAIFMSAT